MKQPWWEDPIFWLCKYWWLALALLALLLRAWFVFTPPPTEAVFELQWSDPNDLDLRVIAPDGTIADFVNPYAFPGLDVLTDANANCVRNISDTPHETVVWRREMPEGDFHVMVLYKNQCGATPTSPFTLEITVGENTQVYQSELAPSEQWNIDVPVSPPDEP